MNSEDKIKKWQKVNPKGKAPLSWDKNDYSCFSDEPPESLSRGITEGESMVQEEVETWQAEIVRTLSVLQEEYPDRFEDQYSNYKLDLDYLASLGKITKEEAKELSKRENFNFDRK